MKIKNTEIVVRQGNPSKVKADIVVRLGGIAREKIRMEKIGRQRVIWVSAGNADSRQAEEILRQTCRSIFVCAQRAKAKTLVIPSLVSVSPGLPEIGAAKIAAQETLRFLREHKSHLQKIIFCLPSRKEYLLFEKNLIGYVHHIQDDLGQGPYVTVDAVIERPGGVILIERSNPPYGWALPGGFVDYGESVETAVLREVQEETGLTLNAPRLLGIYSDPQRDPRFHTISVVYVGKGEGQPQFGDDAKGLKIVPYKDLLKLEYAFDHKAILREYLRQSPSCLGHAIPDAKKG